MQKQCRVCKATYPLTTFSKNADRKDGRQDKCVQCMSLYRKDHYRRNKPRLMNEIHSRRREIAKWFADYKSALACQRCGYDKHPAAIDFHHTDPKEKETTVAEMAAQGSGKDSILAEIKKCTPLCANCHRIVHYEMERAGGFEPLVLSLEG